MYICWCIISRAVRRSVDLNSDPWQIRSQRKTYPERFVAGFDIHKQYERSVNRKHYRTSTRDTIMRTKIAAKGIAKWTHEMIFSVMEKLTLSRYTHRIYIRYRIIFIARTVLGLRSVSC